jgi:hypothetical protein
MQPASYRDAHRYDGAVVQHGRRGELVPCTVQPRDLSVIADVRRYKFLTAPQLKELWWPTSSVQAADRRLLRLFRAGLLDRFRPLARAGSFPWTYHLGGEGHRLLQRAGLLDRRERFAARAVYDFGHVAHEIQLNAWVLAYRRHAGPNLVAWEGETHIQPPAQAHNARQLRLGDDWSARGLIDQRARPIRPDAVLEVAVATAQPPRALLIEYDRTRRVDKNYDKFRRYDTFLNWWSHHTPFAAAQAAPLVIFVCQDTDQRARFLAVAERELTGHRWHPSAPPERSQYMGRRHILFAVEQDAHTGTLEAWRLPAYPRGHPARAGQIRRVHIGPDQPPAAAPKHTTTSDALASHS